MQNRFPGLLALVAIIFFASPAASGGPDDVRVRYSLMRISKAEVGGSPAEVDVLRNNLAIDFGLGASSLGFIYQYADGDVGSSPVKAERGWMLTGSHEWFPSEKNRWEAFARVGLTESDEGSPLYATDTDIRLNWIRYSPEGAWLFGRHPVHPSMYLGGVVNRFGRVQAIGGAGMWWNNWGTYLTALSALNGVEDPANAGEDADRRFAYLKNHGVTLSLSYQVFDTKVELQRNFFPSNGGNDLTFVLEWGHWWRAIGP